MVMVGADPDEMDRVAQQLFAAADEIDQQARTLPAELQALWWIGQVASQFMQAMGSHHIPALQSTTQFLRNAGQELVRQADEQRKASAAETGSLRAPHRPGGGGGGGIGGGPSLSPEAVRRLEADLVRLRRDGDAAVQAAWWAGLSDAEREWLLDERPGDLTGLSGLPADVIEQAQENYSSSIADEVVVRTVTTTAELGVSFMIEVGGGIVAEQVTYADGSVALSLDFEFSAGGNVKLAEFTGELGAGRTYRFANQAEADEFLAGLTDVAVPQGLELLLGPLMAIDALADVDAYLKAHAHHLESVNVNVGGSAKGEVPGLAEAEAGLRVTERIDGQAGDQGAVTVEASLSVKGAGHGMFGGAEGEVQVTASIRQDSAGQPDTLKFEFAHDGSVSGGAWTDQLRLTCGRSVSGTVEVSFDASDPQIEGAVADAARAMARGDVPGAVNAMSPVLDRARIIVQADQGYRGDINVDLVLLEGSWDSKTIDNGTTYVRPPGGSFYRMDTK